MVNMIFANTASRNIIADNTFNLTIIQLRNKTRTFYFGNLMQFMHFILSYFNWNVFLNSDQIALSIWIFPL